MPLQRQGLVSKRNLVVALGLHGSASTWVYNVLRELMIAMHGPENVLGVYSESAQEVIEHTRVADRYVVWKAHRGGPELRGFDRLACARVVVSVRDPRDATVSLMQRFGLDSQTAMQGVVVDCQRAMQCVDAGHPLLRYEQRFFDDPATVTMLAALINAEIPLSSQAQIFARYRTEAIADFANNLHLLPVERVSGAGTGHRYDSVTQIHEGHIGDGRVGKWREVFEPQQQRELTEIFSFFLERFGYVHNSSHLDNSEMRCS